MTDRKNLSLAERRWEENEEYNRNNSETPLVASAPKVNAAEIHRKEKGYSITFGKLMKKWNCATPDEWRALRAKHKREKYVGPVKEKPKKEVVNPTPYSRDNRKDYKGNKKK